MVGVVQLVDAVTVVENVGTGGSVESCRFGPGGVLKCLCECAAWDGRGYVGECAGLGAGLASEDDEGDGNGADRTLTGDCPTPASVISTSPVPPGNTAGPGGDSPILHCCS